MMETKFVYVLVSSETDIYYEQCLLSAYTLRHYNKDSHIIVLVDQATRDTLNKKRSELQQYVDEINVIETPVGYKPVERSRFIKTQIRKYIKGTFLFLDCDTIVTDSLSEIDNYSYDIALVTDFHGDFRTYPFRQYIIDEVRLLFDVDVSKKNKYFNSGAIFCRDTPKAHQLFDKWFELWNISRQKKKYKDQPPLMTADFLLGNVIDEFDGIYNCQVASSVRFLYKAKILHFFNAQYFGNSDYHPFMCKSFYQNIKSEGLLSSNVKWMALHPKELFSQYSCLVNKEKFEYLTNRETRIFESLYVSKNFLYKILRFILKGYNKINRL